MAERHVFLSFIDFVLQKHVNVISFRRFVDCDFLSVLSTNDNLKVKIKYKNTFYLIVL